MKIVIKPTDFHWKMKLKIPLTIGSVPIMDNGNSAALMQANNNSIMRGESTEDPHVRVIPHEDLLDEEANERSTPTIMVTDADNPPDYIPMSKYTKAFVSFITSTTSLQYFM